MDGNDDQQTFRRGQVEWALWRYLTLDRPASTEPPLVFHTRIKKLLDIDRTWSRSSDKVGAATAAFRGTSLAGSGTDVVYTAFDAFCLAVALDLLSAGFKQQEVTLLMSRLRFTLREPFEEALKDPPARTTPTRRHN